MSVRDRLVELKTPEDFHQFLKANPTCALFKAGSCHKTMQGFGYVEEALSAYSLPIAFVRVVDSRPCSNEIASVTGIPHESPQLILMIDCEPVFDVDNWDITLDVLQEALKKYCGPQGVDVRVPSFSAGDMESYRQMLEQYLSDQISCKEFKMLWLRHFQADATLRPTGQFHLLNSLFGDVDAAILQESGAAASSCLLPEDSALKTKAKELLSRLEKYTPF